MRARPIGKGTARELLNIIARAQTDARGPIYYEPEFVGPPAPVSPFAAIGACIYHLERAAGVRS